jgi:hypothetical protein
LVDILLKKPMTYGRLQADRMEPFVFAGFPSLFVVDHRYRPEPLQVKGQQLLQSLYQQWLLLIAETVNLQVLLACSWPLLDCSLELKSETMLWKLAHPLLETLRQD